MIINLHVHVCNGKYPQNHGTKEQKQICMFSQKTTFPGTCIYYVCVRGWGGGAISIHLFLLYPITSQINSPPFFPPALAPSLPQALWLSMWLDSTERAPSPVVYVCSDHPFDTGMPKAKAKGNHLALLCHDQLTFFK